MATCKPRPLSGEGEGKGGGGTDLQFGWEPWERGSVRNLHLTFFSLDAKMLVRD